MASILFVRSLLWQDVSVSIRGRTVPVLFRQQRAAGRDNRNDWWIGRIFLKPTWVNPARDCCAETACIYICRGSCCFEHTIDKTEQLIIPKYSRRATDDPRRTCCHRACAGVRVARRRKKNKKFQRQPLLQSCLSKQYQYSTDIVHLKVTYYLNLQCTFTWFNVKYLTFGTI